MATKVDARGLSCPQPVLMFMDAIKSSNDKELMVLVDTQASMENVSRAAESKGCRVTDISRQEDEYRINIIRD
ncbi:MAG: sulfurtransferase TusA family protein [Desulfamplus sp.]|nr:sulfurtransferase TusA family protein [Desulfamplus sp.]